jgi:hypothetical protein
MRIGAVLAAGLVTIAVALAIVLLDSERRQAGTNYIPELGEAVTVDGAGSHCQDRQLIPADAAALRLLVGTPGEPTPALKVSVRSGAETIASREVREGPYRGHLVVPVGPFEERREAARVCIELLGGKDDGTVLHGTAGQVRLEWLRQGEESWVEVAPAVAHRFGLGKPFLSGGWVLWLAAGLLALAWVAAMRLILREMAR